jgi:hypothetical protein
LLLTVHLQGYMMNQKAYDEVVQFLENLLHPEGFGWAVTSEVHREAKRLLGIIEHEREDVRELS